MSKQFATVMILLVAVIAGGFMVHEYSQKSISVPAVNVILPEKSCDEPLRYSIGRFDEEFGISENEFQQAIGSAAAVWESRTTRDLFAYDSAADFEIELVFDERQRRTIEQTRIQSQLEELQADHQQQANKYENIKQVYERQIRSFEEEKSEYQDELEKYNEEVAYWNDRGGAPEDEYEKLQSQKQKLDEMQAGLEQQRKQINALVTQLNQIAESTNELSQAYQETAETYRSRYGSARRFNQGEYHGDDIQIYQFSDSQDLQLVLVHELGHALGIGHVEESSAIMHPVMQDQKMGDMALTKADITALKDACDLSKEELKR